MAEPFNSVCSICGKPYHVCKTCLEQKLFKPWRTVTDSIEHYKIYLSIHGYTLSKDKEKAKEDLKNCDLSDMKNFKPEIKAIIKEIMAEPKKKSISKKETEELEVMNDDINE